MRCGFKKNQMIIVKRSHLPHFLFFALNFFGFCSKEKNPGVIGTSRKKGDFSLCVCPLSNLTGLSACYYCAIITCVCTYTTMRVGDIVVHIRTQSFLFARQLLKLRRKRNSFLFLRARTAKALDITLDWDPPLFSR